MMRLRDDRLNANIKAGDLKDTDPLMPEVFNRIVAGQSKRSAIRRLVSLSARC